MVIMNKGIRHMGIILDGNRRWARQRGLNPWKGHDAGFDKLRQLFKWCKELNIKEISLYCFSIQNEPSLDFVDM